MRRLMPGPIVKRPVLWCVDEMVYLGQRARAVVSGREQSTAVLVARAELESGTDVDFYLLSTKMERCVRGLSVRRRAHHKCWRSRDVVQYGYLHLTYQLGH